MANPTCFLCLGGNGGLGAAASGRRPQTPSSSLNFGFLPAIPLEVGRIANPTYLAAFAAQ